jgi:hypothetical protein
MRAARRLRPPVLFHARRLRAEGVGAPGAAGCGHGVGWLSVAQAAVGADLRLHMHRAGL